MPTAGTDERTVTDLGEAGCSVDGTTVAIIIPIFNQARFLSESIMSVMAQTRQADEIIVVDDGSTDDPATVVAQFQTVRLIRQDNNRGPSAARNAGLRNSKTTHVVFLDADDRLLPTALESGLACIASYPDCAFVYGGHRLISEDGHPSWSYIVTPITGDAYLAFLRRNLAGPPMTVLFRRDCLLAVHGFDESLRSAEDHDLYLRLTRKYPVASHSEIVSEYRRHGQNVSNDFVAQLKAALLILDRHEARIESNDLTRAILREARADRRSYYVSRMLGEASVRWRARHNNVKLARDLIQAARWSPFFTMRALLHALTRRANKVLQRLVLQNRH